MNQPRSGTVVVVSTGGTIAMRPEAGTGKLVPLPLGHVDGDVIEVRRRPVRSPALPLPAWLALVGLHRLYAGSATGSGVPVVVCSRCAAGRVAPVYGRGGGRDLEEAGALFAGDLAGPKARVLLQLALGAGLAAEATLAAEHG